MTQLWTGNAMVEAMGGRPLGQIPAGVSGVSIDSRTLDPGEAFFAIKGENFDGHDFATAAIKAGASVLVVAEGKLPALGRITSPMIVVPDVLAALERLGAAARDRTAAKIIAVTGSAGKTTTKEALRHALSGQGRTHASAESFNNHWGVPLTLARMPEDTEFGIFEIGMNHQGEIRPLVKLVRPHVAIVTLIAAAHLGHFANLEEIARAKAEIFETMGPNSHALINRDDPHWRLLAKLAKNAGVEHIMGFGEHAKTHFVLTGFQPHDDGSAISAKIAGREVTAIVGAQGRHIAQNVLAVLGAVHVVGGNVEAAASSLATLEAAKGRGRRHRLATPGGDITLIDESYNANPASMKAAVDLLAATPVSAEGRRIAILGDMLELGDHSRKLHAELANHFEGAPIDMALVGGAAMKALADAMPAGVTVEYRDTMEEIRQLALETVRPGDAVMVKSSKSVGFSKIVEALIDRFSPAGTLKKTA